MAEEKDYSQAEAPEVGIYSFANFQVDLATHQLLRDGEVVPIGVKAFDTLVALLRHQHRVVTKEELIKWIWPDSFVSEDSLTHTISAVRRALGDDPTQPRFITTIARRGYRFVAPVSQLPREESPRSIESAPPGELAPAQPSAPAPAMPSAIRPAYLRPLTWATLGAVGAMLIILGVQRFLAVSRASAAPAPLRFIQDLPLGTTLFSGGVLSPDGRYLAFVARDDRSGRTQIWVRPLDAAEARPIDGTDGATRPFWSPDGAFIGFFAGSRVIRVGLSGEAAQTLASTANARPAGGTWGSSGIVVYSDFGTLYSVP
ncbi:MAG: winged helix-turn-helix domain-containing protein, partial [bacterium]